MEDGFLKKFLDESKGLSYIERGARLESAQDIIDSHVESAQEGQTEVLYVLIIENNNCELLLILIIINLNNLKL